MPAELRKTGISVVGDLPWGSHFCHFYETKDDLLDTLLPYFKTGLESGEFCLWVVFDPLDEEEARSALRRAVPEADRHLAAGDIEIVLHAQWYLKDGTLDVPRVINSWKEKLAAALAKGYAGMRVNGNEAWLTEKDWKDFLDYEKKLNEVIAGERMIMLCTYPLAVSRAAEIFDVARSHEFAIARRTGNWEVLETPELRKAKQQIQRLNEELEERVIDRTKELAATNRALRQEMTEHKRAEETLQQAQTRIESVLDSVADTHILFDYDWRYLYVNEAAVRAIGRPREQILGHTLWELYPDIRGTELEHQYHRAMDERLPVAFDFHYLTLNTWWENRFHPVPEGLSVFATNITERKRAEEMRQTFSQRLIEALEAERRRIARELHDEIGQALTAIKMSLLAGQYSAEASPLAPQLNESLGMIDRALQQVRDLSFNLRPSLLDDLGLVAALRWHVDREAQRAGLVSHFIAELSDGRLPPELETACFRIAQEALTNVVRHAQAKQVWIELREHGTELHLVIRDDGIGFEAQTRPKRRASDVNLGLQGMEERVLILGGHLEITTAQSRGTEIHAWFPLKSSPQPQGRGGDAQ